MRKLLLSALSLSLLFASCDIVELTIPGATSRTEVQWGQVSFALSSDAAFTRTRASEPAAETAVNRLQVLIYNEAGNLVSYAVGEGGALSATVPLNIGGHTVYAVTNVSEDLSRCSSPAALTGKISLLKDNATTGLQMIGSVRDQTFTSGSTVNVAVRRFASKVEIDQITTDFTAAAFRSQAFVITGIFLINVNGSCPYSQEPTAGTWYNQLDRVAGDCDAWITDTFASPVTVQTSSGVVTPYTTPHYFYCYANPTTTDTHGGAWSPRRTRLVVATKLGERVYYYPIDIVGQGNVLGVNQYYKVTSLKITGPGVDHPDDLLDNGSVSFSVTVEDWETGFIKDVTY